MLIYTFMLTHSLSLTHTHSLASLLYIPFSLPSTYLVFSAFPYKTPNPGLEGSVVQQVPRHVQSKARMHTE